MVSSVQARSGLFVRVTGIDSQAPHPLGGRGAFDDLGANPKMETPYEMQEPGFDPTHALTALITFKQLRFGPGPEASPLQRPDQ